MRPSDEVRKENQHRLADGTVSLSISRGRFKSKKRIPEKGPGVVIRRCRSAALQALRFFLGASSAALTVGLVWLEMRDGADCMLLVSRPPQLHLHWLSLLSAAISSIWQLLEISRNNFPFCSAQ
ncbi:unnamed protein product [Gadus morhua 'NCC']